MQLSNATRGLWCVCMFAFAPLQLSFAQAQTFDGSWSGTITVPPGCEGSPPPGTVGFWHVDIKGREVDGQATGRQTQKLSGTVTPEGLFTGATNNGRPIVGTFSQGTFEGTFTAQYSGRDCKMTAELAKAVNTSSSNEGLWAGRYFVPSGCEGGPPAGTYGPWEVVVTGQKVSGHISVGGGQPQNLTASISSDGALQGATDSGRQVSGKFTEDGFQGTFFASFNGQECRLTVALRRPGRFSGEYRVAFERSGRSQGTAVACNPSPQGRMIVNGNTIALPMTFYGHRCAGPLKDDGRFIISCGAVGGLGTTTWAGKITGSKISGTYDWQNDVAVTLGGQNECFGTFEGESLLPRASAGVAPSSR